MTVYYPNPTCVLSNGSGPVPGAVVSKVSTKVSGGWAASAIIRGGIDMYQSIDTAYGIAFTDGLGGSQVTPTMCPAVRDEEDENSTESPDEASVEFEDLSSFKMRRPNQNFASFIATSTTAMIDVLSTRAGVTINGDPALYVSEDEAKAAKLADVLMRIAKVAAMDVTVATDNTINLSAWENTSGTLVFDWSTRRHRVDARNLFSGVRLGKSTSMPPSGEQFYGWVEAGFKSEALQAPLFGAEATNIPMTGICGAFTTWDRDPSGPTAKWINHQDLEGLGNYPPPETDQIAAVATHFTAVVLPPGGAFAGSSLTTAVKIRVNGTPESELPSGIDAEFLWPAVVPGIDTSLGSWPAPDFIDSLFPSQSYAISRRDRILHQLNSPADIVTLRGPLQCGTGVQLLMGYTFKGHTYKVYSIEWDFLSNQTTIICVRLGGD